MTSLFSACLRLKRLDFRFWDRKALERISRKPPNSGELLRPARRVPKGAAEPPKKEKNLKGVRLGNSAPWMRDPPLSGFFRQIRFSAVPSKQRSPFIISSDLTSCFGMENL